MVVKGLNAMAGIRCQNPKGDFYVFPNISGVYQRSGIFDPFWRGHQPARYRFPIQPDHTWVISTGIISCIEDNYMQGYLHSAPA
jgi:aspartate/methionine/tyrosine aminotransferase